MIVVSVKADISAFRRKLTLLEREQMPYATAVALTRSAKYAQQQLVDAMDQAFDRPTPYTKHGLYIVPARKTMLIAQVKVKDEAFKGNPAVRFLLPEVQGGARNIKGFENLLIRSGVMPAGYYAVPASGAPLDAYGNVPGSAINRILSQLHASRDPLSNQTAGSRQRAMHKKMPTYFAVGVDAKGGLAPGIYQRMGTASHAPVKPIFVFTRKRPQYSSRYRFYDIGEQAARERFPTEMKQAMAQAIATAR